jgi:CDP-diglyceride synthetase
MLSLGFILAFIGAAVALLLGILIFSEVTASIDCPFSNPFGNATKRDAAFGTTECENAEDTGWTVIGILPVALFFALFAMFGSLGGKQ